MLENALNASIDEDSVFVLHVTKRVVNSLFWVLFTFLPNLPTTACFLVLIKVA